MVRKLRIIFPVVAACLLVSVLVFSDRKDPIEAKPIEEVIPQKMGENELINAEFNAQDEQDRPFSITSERAFQDEVDSNDVKLEKPIANMKFDDGTRVSLKGKNGTYKQEEQLLHLKGDVKFIHDEGYELNTTEVDIDIEKQTAISKVPVTGHGPAGDIKASGLNANGKDAIFIFEGPATLILTPEEKEKPISQ